MAESGQEANPQASVENPPVSSSSSAAAKDSVAADEKPTKAAPAFPQLSIWPPSQRTRDAVIQRLVETLTSPSVLSKRYGVLPHDEASAAARVIEGEAFAAAGADVAGDSIEEGIEVLQIYSKEISKRVLESAKARAGSPPSSITTAEDESGAAAPPSTAEVDPPLSESAASTVGASEVSSVESETLTA